MQARLPQDKLAALREELSHFKLLHASCLRCTKRQLLSLIGKLAFSCKVIPAGYFFLRRLLDTAHSVKGLEKQVPIMLDTCKDVEWWLAFVSRWNGIAFFLEPNWTPAHEFQLFTDASGHLGYGAFWNGHWFRMSWPPNLLNKSIEWKELYAIVTACRTWGSLSQCRITAIMRQWLRSGNLVAHAVQTLWTWCGPPCVLWRQIIISMF